MAHTAALRAGCLCKDDAFDVPDVYGAEYIPRCYYSTEITLSPRTPARRIRLPTFDARRLFANRFRREFSGRINREACISDTRRNVASRRRDRRDFLPFPLSVYRVFRYTGLQRESFSRQREIPKLKRSVVR